MLLKKGLQNVDIEPLIVVHGYVAKPDHGLEALAKRGLNDLRLFQEHKVFFQAVRQPEFLVSHDVSCQVNGWFVERVQFPRAAGTTAYRSGAAALSIGR